MMTTKRKSDLSAEPAAREKDDRYNLVGRIENLVITTDRVGQKMAKFDIVPPGKSPQPCIAFNERAEQAARLREGETGKVFGFYEKREIRDPATGVVRKTQRVKTLWVGQPRNLSSKSHA